MTKSWQQLSSKKILDNQPYWDVIRDDVIKPDDNKGTYTYVDFADFVTIVALDDNDKSMYLVRQWRYPIEQNSWEFSMGAIEKGEAPLQAAQREFEEEVGLKATKWEEIGYSHVCNGLTNQAHTIFIARDFTPGKQSLENSELDMITRKFSLEEVEGMVARGELRDGPTIAALYYLNLYFKKS